MALFNVTYDIITQESAEQGDSAESGFICHGARLQNALLAVHDTRTSRVGGVECIIECDSSPCTDPRWITVYNTMEYETGAYESRSLHIPNNVTAASARRIARLVGARVP
jgi:hypothetical protein